MQHEQNPALFSGRRGAFFAAAAEAGVKNGGFYGPTADSASVTVEQAKQMKDETFVVLRGKIKQMVGKEKYLFEDQSGSIGRRNRR